MPVITWEGKQYACAEGETVLEALERQGAVIPSSCRAGACQTCLVRAIRGNPGEEAQRGLKDTQKAQNWFLACLCKPTEDLEIGLPKLERFETELAEKTALNESVIRLRMPVPDGFAWRAGQFVNLIRPQDGLTRSYSLASIESDGFLELHVRRVPEGRMTGWLFDEVETGEMLHFTGPAGDSFYVPGKPEQPLLLIGTGTGLAPLYGILRDALAAGHAGPIHLFHASLAVQGLYMMDELRALAKAHAQVHYHPCVLHGDAPEGGHQGNIADIPAQVLGSLAGWRVHLCGDPGIVRTLKQKCFLAGASMQDIHSDPFEPAAG